MTTTELITKVAQTAEITKKDAKEIVTTTFDVIADILATGEDVKVGSLGSFVVKETAARTGRNPQDGSAIQIPASHKIQYRPASALKEAVKEI